MALVAQVTSGQEAIEAFEEHQPDVTLMDYSMSEISGLEATRLILQRFPLARIIIMSVMVSAEFSKSEALAAGALACLEKEGSIQQLAETIRRVHHEVRASS
jgi:CheY-like chemotaxis protein